MWFFSINAYEFFLIVAFIVIFGVSIMYKNVFLSLMAGLPEDNVSKRVGEKVTYRDATQDESKIW